MAWRAVTGFSCEQCGFKLWLPVAELDVSSLGLYDDARFPGRCLLVYRQHAEHLDELSPAEAWAFLEDGRRAARAIRALGQVLRINFAVLGNTEPHLHMHLIPRRGDDPKPQRTPWEHPDERRNLDGGQVGEIVEALRRGLAGS